MNAIGMSIVSMVGLAFLSAGCAGRMLAEPPAVDPMTAAQGVVVRPSNVMVGIAATNTVTLDGVAIFELGNGEHAIFAVAPGEHLVGRRYWDFGPVVRAVSLHAEAARTYYFVLDNDLAGAHISRVSEAEGKAMAAKTTAVGDDTRRGQRWNELR